MEVDWEELEAEVEEEEGAEDDSRDVGMVPNLMLCSPFQQEPFWPFFMVAAGERASVHSVGTKTSEETTVIKKKRVF